MATDEGGGSSSSLSQAEKQLMREALSKVNDCVQKLEQDLEKLMSLKGNDESTEKAICDSMEKYRIEFIHRFSRFISLIANQSYIEVEIMRSILKMIASFKKKHKEATMARRERRQLQMNWIDFNVDALISQLCKTASQVEVCEKSGKPDLVLCSKCNKYTHHSCNNEDSICNICDPKQKRLLDPPAIREMESKRPKVKHIDDKEAIRLAKRKSQSPKTSVTKTPPQPNPEDTSNHPVVYSTGTESQVEGTLCYFPSGVETWKGRFLLSGEFFGRFEAQPPWIINHKAYEFSKSMPRDLEVGLIPKDQVWNILFKNRTPELSDIALYILPCANIERSEENYGSLLGHLESERSVLVSWVGPVALIICTSKQLNSGSRLASESWVREKFMWGIFAVANAKFQLPTELVRFDGN